MLATCSSFPPLILTCSSLWGATETNRTCLSVACMTGSSGSAGASGCTAWRRCLWSVCCLVAAPPGSKHMLGFITFAIWYSSVCAAAVICAHSGKRQACGLGRGSHCAPKCNAVCVSVCVCWMRLYDCNKCGCRTCELVKVLGILVFFFLFFFCNIFWLIVTHLGGGDTCSRSGFCACNEILKCNPSDTKYHNSQCSRQRMLRVSSEWRPCHRWDCGRGISFLSFFNIPTLACNVLIQTCIEFIGKLRQENTHTRTDDPDASPDCTEPSVLLINKGSQRSGGFAVASRRHVIKERCLLSCWISWATQDASFRWKQDNSARASCCADRFPARRNIFIYCLSDQVVMESGSEISVEERALGSTIWWQYPHTSFALFLWLSPWRCLSSDTPLTCHLPVDTFTTELLSFFPLPHFQSCIPPLHYHHLYTGHVTLLLCQCVWLKCSRRRNNICDKNFMVSGTSSALWRKRHLFFIFLGCHFFLLECFWVETRCFLLLLSPNTLKQGGQRDWWGWGRRSGVCGGNRSRCSLL